VRGLPANAEGVVDPARIVRKLYYRGTVGCKCTSSVPLVCSIIIQHCPGLAASVISIIHKIAKWSRQPSGRGGCDGSKCINETT
jgi:hypothetical protein